MALLLLTGSREPRFGERIPTDIPWTVAHVFLRAPKPSYLTCNFSGDDGIWLSGAASLMQRCALDSLRLLDDKGHSQGEEWSVKSQVPSVRHSSEYSYAIAVAVAVAVALTVLFRMISGESRRRVSRICQ